jgi:hypothetical protein
MLSQVMPPSASAALRSPMRQRPDFTNWYMPTR